MKIVAARLNHETNTFSPLATPLAAFGPDGPTFGAAALASARGTRTALGAFIDIAQARGDEIAVAVNATANKQKYLASLERTPKRLRVALCLEPFSGVPLDAEVAAIAERAAATCERLGHRVEIARPEIDVDEFKGAHGIAAVCGMAANLDARARSMGRAITQDDIEALTWNNYQWGQRVSAVTYVQAIGVLRKLGFAVAQFFERYDVLLTPTMACLPPKLGTIDTMDAESPTNLDVLYRMIGFTALFNDTGNPAISLPLGRSKSGLGASFPRGEEQTDEGPHVPSLTPGAVRGGAAVRGQGPWPAWAPARVPM